MNLPTLPPDPSHWRRGAQIAILIELEERLRTTDFRAWLKADRETLATRIRETLKV